jgi:nucleoside-diphosphate-sugar epimerase
METVFVTGVAGNLGNRLLANLANRRVIGVDMRPPSSGVESFTHFEEMDLGDEASCDRLVSILRQYQVATVIHLAFVIDPLQNGILDVDRMWRINVAGTARVMEAIAEVNRMGGDIRKFIFPSSVSAYGPETPELVTEDFPLAAHTLPYAVHKKEADEVVQRRAYSLGACSTFILRPHIFVGASMQNYLVGALRGTPTGKGRLAVRMRAKQTRLPLMLPYGRQYLEKTFQFVHVDDVARLIAHIVEKKIDKSRLEIMNVAGRAEPLTLAQCAEIAKAKIVRLPGRWLCKLVLKLMWKFGISGIPPDAFPYMIGSFTMNTSRLQTFLGNSYRHIIRYTVADALADSFVEATPQPEPLLKGLAGSRS